jgi:hypothetical protein
MKAILTILIALLTASGAATAVARSTGVEATRSVLLPPNVTLVAVDTASTDDGTTIIVPDDGNAPRHVARYRTLDLTPYGVPTDATGVVLAFKAVLTKGLNDGTAAVFAHVRPPGSNCCLGGPDAPNFPADGAWWGTRVQGLVAQSVAQLPRDAQRNWSYAIVPSTNGRVEYSWGYTRVEGDSAAIAVYLNGWTK